MSKNDANNDEDEEIDNSITLELGDVIQLFAPANSDIHENTYVIIYIDNELVKLVDTATVSLHQLHITEDGHFTDESIEQIYLLDRSDEKGYARQNHLLPKTWVDIHFGGDTPIIITGEITNLEEDMIEVTTFPDLKAIYLNFEYKGIPLGLPIEQISIREKPASLKGVKTIRDLVEGKEPTDTDEVVSIEYLTNGESVIRVPENYIPDKNPHETLHEFYVSEDDLFFGEMMGKIQQIVEIAEEERRYGIEIQVNDLMDELLSVIPTQHRTKMAMLNIHRLIERYRQLRSEYSLFDVNKNAYQAKVTGTFHKPLVDRLLALDVPLYWILPVVTQIKKIYDAEYESGEPDVAFDKIMNLLTSVETIHRDFGKSPVMNYKRMNEEIEHYMKPFDVEAATGQIQSNMDTLVDNLQDHYSNVFSKDGAARRKYVVQRYNMGSSMLEKNDMKQGKTIYLRKPMTNNDDISVKSFAFLPDPVIHFSKINLPTTNMLERSSLHHHFFHLFRVFTPYLDMDVHTIDEPFDDFYENDQSIMHGLFKKPTEFKMASTVDIRDPGVYKRFVESIIPKTRFLIKMTEKQVTNHISFIEVVRRLEPFLIYTKDITYGQYKEIRFLIKEKIAEITKHIAQSSVVFSNIRNKKYNTKRLPNSLLRHLTDARSIEQNTIESFFRDYRLDKDGFATEILNTMLTMDYGNLYDALSTYVAIPLMTTSRFLDAVLDDVDQLERVKPSDCSRRFLAKRYSSLGQLQKDNHIEEIYYDKEFDDTPYTIVDKYKDKRSKMSPELFLEFLKENLIHKHDCPPELAEELASTLISKKKRVRDGEYALLEIAPKLPGGKSAMAGLSEEEKKEVETEADVRKKTAYYKRIKNIWVIDHDIEEESFMNNNILFCNLSTSCYKNTETSVCELSTDAATRMKQLARTKMMNEFDKRYEVSEQNLHVSIGEVIEARYRLLNKMKHLREIAAYKSNNVSYEIGNMVSTVELKRSPYFKLRELIMTQDFVSKQQSIARFTDQFCREPMVAELEEDIHWFYCKQTNTKLMPKSLVRLARCFVEGRNYQTELDMVCREVGELSDDNDAIVDKHSGYVLRKIDFSAEEGFDAEGFHITTNDILEKDLGTAVLENLGKKPKRVFENETSEKIYNIINTVCSHIDVPIEGIDEFVIRMSYALINSPAVNTVEVYERLAKTTREKKGKELPPYATYLDSTYIYIVAAYLLIAIQTAIPSFRTRKTFPGCVRSFSGFPYNGEADKSGLTYIACVLEKSKSSIAPWDSIKKLKASSLAERIESFIRQYIISLSDVQQLFIAKREYSLLHPDLIVPEERNVEKWAHFLPPIIPVKVVKGLKPVAGNFNSELMNMIQKKSVQQSTAIFAAKGKVLQYGYSLVEIINEVVDNKTALLKTASHVPFVENSCCNETSIVNPMTYFNENDGRLRVNITAAGHLIRILRDVELLAKPVFLFNSEYTGLRHIDVPMGQTEENLYYAVIHYCNFDRNLPIPEQLKIVCKEKPDGYRSSWTIAEKVAFFKQQGKHYTPEHLHQLMGIINNKNKVSLQILPHFKKEDGFRNMIETLNTQHSTAIPEPVLRLLIQVLNKHDSLVSQRSKGWSDEPTEELGTLKSYLSTAIEKTGNKVLKFIGDFAKLGGARMNTLEDFIRTIDMWTIDNVASDKYYDEGLYSITKFMENAIMNISRVYPSMLMTDDHSYRHVPKQWNLSYSHEKQVLAFIQAYYVELDKFKKNPVLAKLLVEVKRKLTDVVLFINSIPMYTNITKNIGEGDEEIWRKFHLLFDKHTIYMLHSYCFLTSLDTYIEQSFDVELLQEDRELIRQSRREQVRESEDDSLRLTSFVESEGDDPLDEVEITIGNQQTLKETVASLLVSFLNIEIANKHSINITYDDIMKKERLVKEKETESIVKYFGNLDDDERRVENMYKNFKMGRWNVGMQKGVFEYDKETFDREQNELLRQLNEGEAVITGEGEVALAEGEGLVDGDELEEEGYDVIDANLDDNYMDGVFYEEDRDDDGFNNY